LNNPNQLIIPTETQPTPKIQEKQCHQPQTSRTAWRNTTHRQAKRPKLANTDVPP